MEMKGNIIGLGLEIMNEALMKNSTLTSLNLEGFFFFLIPEEDVCSHPLYQYE